MEAVLGICQLMLSQKARQGPVTSEDIAAVVAQVCAMPSFATIDRNALQQRLEERFTVYTPDHETLGSNDGHLQWLAEKKEANAIEWRYWQRYYLLLQGRLPQTALDKGVDNVTEDVLGRLEDPTRPGVWDRRGLVMGHVQSGKTANYCGLVCKAADAGYKVIIILTGVHESLRSQTQIRIDEGFLGFMSEPVRADGQAFTRTGVGLIDSAIHANTGTNRLEDGDFSRAVANQFGIHPGGLPLLFVVKKNTHILRNLLAWVNSCADAQDPDTGRRFVSGVPLLVIDDEADLASIDTRQQAFDEFGNPDPDHDPTTINRLIRQILRSFGKAAYVAYTATPFANIFIHDRGYTPEFGDDLFPRSFIVNLPAPDNYIGPAKVFGLAADADAGTPAIPGLPLARVVSDHAESESPTETRGWMPPKLLAKTGHQPRYKGESKVPPSLDQAMRSFILATAVRRARQARPLHNSMLIHVARYTNVQRIVAQQVETALREIVQRLRHGDGARTPSIFDEFRQLWETDFVPTNQQCSQTPNTSVELLPEWNVVRDALCAVAESIRIRLINGSAADILDYETHKNTGLTIIAVGGDKLSRGLTLEGLTVSYFLRSSRMYDTLMQMGRWFGYRDGYVDVCRLYTTTELIEWFTHIAGASEELQREFQHMISIDGTPRDYGLKVRSHPVLLVTSAVKMRNGTNLRLSFSGAISETIIFRRDETWLRQNFDATKTWLASLGNNAGGEQQGGYQWINISVDKVLSFLAVYRSHEDAHRVDTNLLSRYIRAQIAQGELLTWTVRLCSSGLTGATPDNIAGRDVGLIRRTPYPDIQRSDRYTIRRLVSPSDEMIDLSTEELERAMVMTVAHWGSLPEHQRGDRPTQPGGRYIRTARSKTKGLLLLYPLDPLHAAQPRIGTTVMGLAISFPRSDTARDIEYTVNNVFLQQGDDESL